VAAALRKEPGMKVELVNGDHGEFTVSVDGREVARKGETLPRLDEVVAAVKNAETAAAR